ncbi:hypothetical protein PMIT1306_01842 [Prochlorococcus sp. MIT 1306]|nr:hypothetical protein PMIT1306_01842 [Prochlorococcus sp. MIT 1306]
MAFYLINYSGHNQRSRSRSGGEVFCIYWQVLQLQASLLPVSVDFDHCFWAEL